MYPADQIVPTGHVKNQLPPNYHTVTFEQAQIGCYTVQSTLRCDRKLVVNKVPVFCMVALVVGSYRVSLISGVDDTGENRSSFGRPAGSPGHLLLTERRTRTGAKEKK
jgi:hypothetical protein